MIDIVKHAIALVYLVSGSVTDIRTREVSDWSNYGLIALGFMTSIAYSIYYSSMSFIYESISGFLIFLAVALLMYYTGQWGGGDSKMLMGMGALYGFWWPGNSFLLTFIINTLIAGAAYGIIWTVIVACINWRKFIPEYKKVSEIHRGAKIGSYVALFLAFILAFFIKDIVLQISFLSFGVIIYMTMYLWLIIKAVETSCMLKLVAPDKLTEGDWIAKDVTLKGRHLVGPKDLGIEKKQIALLKRLYRQKKIKKVLVKDGIPFVPSFFFGWIMAIAGINFLFFLL